MKAQRHREGSFDISPTNPKRLWGVAMSNAQREWVFLGDKWSIRLRPGRKTRATPNLKLRRAHRKANTYLSFKQWAKAQGTP